MSHEKAKDVQVATDEGSSALGGFQGKVFERRDSGNLNLKSVTITFESGDGSVTKVAVTDANGAYKIRLAPAFYNVTATHPDYKDFRAEPGFSLKPGKTLVKRDIVMEPMPREQDEKGGELQLIAFVCQRLRKAPNPDLTLEWEDS